MTDEDRIHGVGLAIKTSLCRQLPDLPPVSERMILLSSYAFDVLNPQAGGCKSSGRWLLGNPWSTVVRQLAPIAWCPLQCLLAKTVCVLSPGVGGSGKCSQEFAPQSHIHSGLNRQDLVSSDVFLADSDQYADGRWWFGSCQGC